MGEKKWVRLDDKKIGSEAQKMIDALGEQVIGQTHALKEVAHAVEIATSGFAEPRKPLGRLLFLGPSGSGKTWMAEAMAEYLFNSPDALTKVNCSEFVEEHQISKLIGSPPGYVGFQNPGGPKAEHPIFTNWNLYKHHLNYLREKYGSLLKDMAALSKEFKDKKDHNDQLGKTVRESTKNAEMISDHLKTINEEIDKLLNDPELDTDPVKRAKLEEKRRIAMKLEEKLDVYRQAGENSLHEFISSHQEYRDMETKLRKLKSEFEHEGVELKALSWDGNGPPPKGLKGIVLIDEIEKSDQALWHLFYEILDKGRAVAGNGSPIFFTGCYLIFTGNVGDEMIAGMLGNDDSGHIAGFGKKEKQSKHTLGNKIYEETRKALYRVFPKPFIGRFSSIEVFRPFDNNDMGKILDKQLQALGKELDRRGCGLNIEVDEDVREKLVERAMKYQELGARILKERFDHYIRLKIIRLVVTKQVQAGDSVRVKSIKDQDEFEFLGSRKEQLEEGNDDLKFESVE